MNVPVHESDQRLLHIIKCNMAMYMYVNKASFIWVKDKTKLYFIDLLSYSCKGATL